MYPPQPKEKEYDAVCPRCGGKGWVSGRRPLWKRLLRAFSIHAFRCKRCNRRFFRWNPPLKQQPGEKRRRIPDPQVREAADQYDAARTLLHRRLPGSGVLLPLLNVTAVTVELYLKSLSARAVHQPLPDFSDSATAYAASEVAGHKLSALLNAIPDDIRTRLEREFEEQGHDESGAKLRDVLWRYEGLFAETRDPLGEQSYISRYPLEPLTNLCKFLKRFVSKLEPVERMYWR